MKKWLLLTAVAGLCAGQGCPGVTPLFGPILTPAPIVTTPVFDSGGGVCDPTVNPACGTGVVCDPVLNPSCACDPLLNPSCGAPVVPCDPNLDPTCNPIVTCDPTIDPFCSASASTSSTGATQIRN